MKPLRKLPVILALLSLVYSAMAAEPAKPNIVFIVGDDCGYDEFSFQDGRIPPPRQMGQAEQAVDLGQHESQCQR